MKILRTASLNNIEISKPQKYQKLMIIEQNLVLFLPFSLFTATCASCCLPQQQKKSRKYFSAHQYPNFRKFRHQASAIAQNRFIQRNKKRF